MKRESYTSYARICVYMNISKPLPEYIELEYHDEIWQQPIITNIYLSGAERAMNTDITLNNAL